jgi:shikimate kinase
LSLVGSSPGGEAFAPVQGITLIGYRGSGKSTVGRILAARLNRTFLDCDWEIARRAGRSISAIFSESGEPEFREWEEKTLAELLSGSPHAIVATGGGAVLREANRRRIRAFGLVVWLTAPVQELTHRIATDACQQDVRPALSPAGTLAEIAQLLDARTPFYRGLADLVVDTSDKTPDQVADLVIFLGRL